jgi:hypothetical protein
MNGSLPIRWMRGTHTMVVLLHFSQHSPHLSWGTCAGLQGHCEHAGRRRNLQSLRLGCWSSLLVQPALHAVPLVFEIAAVTKLNLLGQPVTTINCGSGQYYCPIEWPIAAILRTTGAGCHRGRLAQPRLCLTTSLPPVQIFTTHLQPQALL